MADGFRRKPILRANQCGSAKEVLCLRPWSQDGWPSFRRSPLFFTYSLFRYRFIVACDSSHSLRVLFSPYSDPSQASSGPWLMSFLLFLSPYHLGLRYVPCLKTTLRPWDQMSSSAASTWTGLIQLCSDYQDREICAIIITYWMLTEMWTWSLPYGAPEIHPASFALLDTWMPSCLSIWEVILDICARFSYGFG
ncbi:hypothetical protein CK203_042625 [Vitis vinifera]|uniref:Uncharacterized protein n=1 Tax=Vitis vinifera TaxID=29760 RepID=A0A438I7R6_VITVI|nr:hypothetical protein CK203_042625 [Vitis vinifera]